MLTLPLDIPEGLDLEGGLELGKGGIFHHPGTGRQHQAKPGWFSRQIDQVTQVFAGQGLVFKGYHLSMEVDHPAFLCPGKQSVHLGQQSITDFGLNDLFLHAFASNSRLNEILPLPSRKSRGGGLVLISGVMYFMVLILSIGLKIKNLQYRAWRLK